MPSTTFAGGCPLCTGATRTLAVYGSSRRHHQCLRCGHRYATARGAAPAIRDDHLRCLYGLPAAQREIVEGLVLLMVGTGTLVGPVERVARDMAALRLEHGPPSAVLRGMAMPVFSWLVEQGSRHASHLVVIDQGTTRVCFRVRRRRSLGPL